MELLVNQLGYETTGPKRAILQREEGTGTGEENVGDVAVVDRETETIVYEATPEWVGPVANWGWTYWTVDFSGVAGTGEYALRASVDGETVRSRPFRIEERVCQDRLLSDIAWYFKSQRTSGVYELADRQMGFVGDRDDRDDSDDSDDRGDSENRENREHRDDTVDVRGGWYDASADVSKYLSHLSYANFMNPQQIPMVVWGLLDGLDRLGGNETGLVDPLGHRIREEACHGADYLVRACDDDGYFYTTVFDGWSHDPGAREICAFEGPEGVKTDDYEAGFRQGGGVAIAALARASRLEVGSHGGFRGQEITGGEFDTETYLETAVRAFEHLQEHNEDYLDDGRENVIDDYCALLAATELAGATDGEQAAEFREVATERARSLLDRQTGDERYGGWFRADETEESDERDADDEGDGGDGPRPYFHAAEEGLPVVALHCYLTELEAVPIAEAVRAAIERYWRYQVEITEDVVNPFGYPRQYVKGVEADDPRAAFFLPHDNETGYWWQGENARLGSIAAAAFRSRDVLGDSELEARLTDLAHDAVDWILGKNPYDTSMVHGVGNHAPDYHPAMRNAPGGVVNGITAAVDDPEGIAFCPEPQANDLEERWRWAEQWLPHAAWLFLALCSTERI